MIDLGKQTPGSTVVIPFHTFDSNDPSASVAIAAFVVGDVEIYRDGNIVAAAERSSTTGYTLIDTDGIDLDSIVGIGGLTVDLSSNAVAGFWRAGSQYTVIIGPVTVDAAVVNFIPVTFTIGYDGAFRETTIETVTSQTAFVLPAAMAPPDDNAFNGCRAIVHDVATADQWSFVDVTDYAASSRTVTLATGAIFTVVATDNISFFPPAMHATRSAALDDWINGGRLDLLLDALIATVGVAGAGLGDLGGMSTAMIAEVNATVDIALSDIDLDHLIAVAESSDVTTNSIIGKLAAANGDFSDYVSSTDSHQAIRDWIGDGSNLTETGSDGDHLTAINLPNQTMDITGNITGNLSGSVGSVTAETTADVTAISGDATAAANLEALMEGSVATTVNDESASPTLFIVTSSEATNDDFK